MISFLPLLYLMGKPFSAVIKKYFLYVCSNLSLPRQAGAACGLYSFLLRQKVIQYHIETQFTPVVILER